MVVIPPPGVRRPPDPEQPDTHTLGDDDVKIQIIEVQWHKGSAPDQTRRFDYALQLAPLVGLGDEVAECH
jgi:hypothetical protein